MLKFRHIEVVLTLTKTIFVAISALNALAKSKITEDKMLLDRIALILVIIGAANWGSIGLFRFDAVAWICGGQEAMLARIIYTVVSLAGIWCISLLFRSKEEASENVR